jgi:hypothetical protein
MSAALAALAALVLLAGCAKHETTAKAPLTEAQRDSILATEPIPGAPAVGGALKAAGKEAAHAAAVDSAVH